MWIESTSNIPELPVPQRILGGRLAYADEIPYIVQLQSPTGHICGGAILATYLILTAAHCFNDRNYKTVKVVAGQYHLPTATNDRDDGTEQYRNIKSVLIHPGYDAESYSLDNDIALLILETQLEFNQVVNSILIPKENDVFEPIATVSGWGVSEETNFEFSKRLRRADVLLHNGSFCTDIFDHYNYDFEAEVMLCAGGRGKDACQGDSGGPLTCIHQNSHSVKKYLCGITSGGQDCRTSSVIPGVYTKVSRYHDWIMQETKDIRPQYNCPENYIRCRNFMCIPKLSICDGFEDCSDGSDEMNCGTFCNSLENVSPEIRCDGATDCDNGLDEVHCAYHDLNLTANPDCAPIFVECDYSFQCKLLFHLPDSEGSAFLLQNSQVFVDGRVFRNEVLILMK